MEKEKRKHGDARPNLFLLLLSFIWKAISAAGKGIGWFFSLVAVGAWWLLKQAGASIGWMLKQPYRLLRYIISGRIPDFENARQEEIFWRIKRQYRRKRLFLINSLLYAGASVLFLITLGDSYFRWQSAIQRGDQYASYLATNFYNILIPGGFIVGIWTLVLIFHFVFNRMGDSEDKALGEALENEYARSEARENRKAYLPDVDRLMDNTQEDYYDDYDERKPKRNGARM